MIIREREWRRKIENGCQIQWIYRGRRPSLFLPPLVDGHERIRKGDWMEGGREGENKEERRMRERRERRRGREEGEMQRSEEKEWKYKMESRREEKEREWMGIGWDEGMELDLIESRTGSTESIHGHGDEDVYLLIRLRIGLIFRMIRFFGSSLRLQ